MEQIREFLLDNMTTVFVVTVSILSLLIIFAIISIIRNKIQATSSRNKIIFPEKYVNLLKEKEEKEKPQKKKVFFLKKIYQEYCFYFESGKKIIIASIMGYLIFFLILFMLSDSIPLSLILAISFDILLYIFVDNKTAKARKKYIKDFANAINVLSVSTEAGNTIPKAIQTVVARNTIGERIRREFSYINNDLKNNKSLEEALESFYERNRGIQEITMFVVIVQFYNKKGGSGLKDIFAELAQNLTNKINNYAEIDAEIGIYKMLMNLFIYAYVIALLFIDLFMPTFYPDLIDQGTTGIVKALFSIVCYGFAIWFYKSMLRNSAEG